MEKMKEQAIGVIDQLHMESRIDHADYCTIHDALNEIDTLRDRDEELEELWAELEDVPIDPDTEKLEDDWFIFPHGTGKEEIWRWFDERHSKGAAYLLYGDGIDRTDQIAKLVYLKQLCTECDSESCVFNPNGVCLSPFVTGHAPAICDDGCGDYCYKEV